MAESVPQNPAEALIKKDIMPARESGDDEAIFEVGKNVVNKKGEEGTFIGFHEEDGKQFAKYQFGDIINSIPRNLAKDRVSIVASTHDDEATTSTSSNVVRDIKASIAENANYTVDTFDFVGLSESAKVQLAKLLNQARRMGAIFRGDFQHPYAKGKMDRTIDYVPIEAGIFEKGILHNMGRYGGQVFTSPSIETAKEYPQASDLPPGWDGTSYLYILDPTSILEKPESLQFIQDMVEILSGSIMPSDVLAAIEYNQKTRQFVGIHRNRFFHKPDLYEKFYPSFFREEATNQSTQPELSATKEVVEMLTRKANTIREWLIANGNPPEGEILKSVDATGRVSIDGRFWFAEEEERPPQTGLSINPVFLYAEEYNAALRARARISLGFDDNYQVEVDHEDSNSPYKNYYSGNPKSIDKILTNEAAILNGVFDDFMADRKIALDQS